jgi:hypothetical protein
MFQGMYGPPNMLSMRDLPIPGLGPNDVLCFKLESHQSDIAPGEVNHPPHSIFGNK